MEIGRIVILWTRSRLGHQPLTFDAQVDWLRLLRDRSWLGFTQTPRFYYELQANVTTADRQVGVIRGGECPHAGQGCTIVKQFSAERCYQSYVHRGNHQAFDQ